MVHYCIKKDIAVRRSNFFARLQPMFFILTPKGAVGMKKTVIKVYVFSVEKAEKSVRKNKKSQSNIVRNWVEDYLDTLVFSEDEKGRADNE